MHIMETPPKTLLIIDDDTILRQALAAFFKDKGYKVSEADNGKIGIAAASSEKPMAILLDIMMPEMGGIQAIKALKESNPDLLPRITLMTNSSDMNFLSDAVELGVLKYILKGDMSLEDIFKTVDAYAGK